MKKAKLKKPKKPHLQSESSSSSKFLWIGVVTLVFIIVAAIVWRRTASPFEFVGGDESVIVLLRNDYAGNYQVRYIGDEPTTLNRVVPIIESPQRVLYVSIQDVFVVLSGKEIRLETGGYVPEGQTITLQPGETFTIKVVYYGEEIGGHYVYGFRLGYGPGNEIQLIIRDREFTVFVE